MIFHPLHVLLLTGALTMATPAGAVSIDAEDVWNGRLEAVRAALDAGADPEAPLRVGDYHPTPTESPLVAAAAHGWLEVVKLLVERGADPERRVGDTNDMNALEAAVQSQYDRVALWLLEVPGPSQDYLGRAFWCSFQNGYVSRTSPTYLALARRALARGLPVDHPQVRRAVHSVARAGDLATLRTLAEELHARLDLEPEAFPTRYSSNREPYQAPLIDAAANGHREVVAYLLDGGVDVNRDGGAALLQAAANRHPEVIELLLVRHADPTVRDAKGHGAMYLALERGAPESAAALERAGAVMTPAEVAERTSAQELLARRARELEVADRDQAREDHARRVRESLPATVTAFLVWGAYAGAMVWARQSGSHGGLATGLSDANLWAGPLLAGIGLGLISFREITVITPSRNWEALGTGAIGGAIIGVSTALLLGVLNYTHRGDFRAHAALYYAAPVLTLGAPIYVMLLRF
jgi:ankyrin repeat protein